MQIFVSCIFEIRPEQWYLRGDPCLWNELEEHFQTKELPYTKKQFKADFYRSFQQITGEEIKRGKRTRVSRYIDPAGGMSNGTVCHDFWITVGLPLLISRLKAANKEYRKAGK